MATAQQGTFKMMLKMMLQGDVPQAQVDAVRNNLNIYTLLDTRSPEEFAVSHIRGALFADYKTFEPAQLGPIPRNTSLLVYCSVGKRSEDIGRKLLASGFTNVLNLYGGIFQWVNEGLPIVDNMNQPTTKIHAYNRAWGLMLQKGEKVY